MTGAARAFPSVRPPRSGLLEPQSIAIIGASDQPGNLGARIISYLQKFGFGGRVWPVNPRRETVAGMRCYPSPASLPEAPDLAVVTISAALATDAVRGCIEAGIRNGIVLAGGFAEVGAEGEAMQRELAALCRAHDFQLCGPNTLGIVNTWLPMTASFASHLMDLPQLRRGDISVVSQSGGTAAVVHALAERAGFGFRYMVSVGNEAALTVADYLRLIADDPHTKIVGMYLEGARDGDDFLEALARVRAAGKPVVILKAGVAEVSARAAAAHTGSLAGEARIWDAVLAEHGVVRVATLTELLDTLLALSAGASALPEGNGVALVCAEEGAAGVTADLCRRERLEVRRQASIPSGGDGLAGLGELLDTLAADPFVDSVFFDAALVDVPSGPRMDAVLGDLAAFRKCSAKPLFVGLCVTVAERETLAEAGIYAFPETSRAVETIARLVKAGGVRRWIPRRRPPPLPFAWSDHVRDCAPGTVISEHDCHALLAAAGLDVAAGRLARSREEAIEAARAVAYPVAMKGISPAVTHRAAAGLLVLDIGSEEAAAVAHDRLLQRAEAMGVALDGIYVQHMERGETEIIVSALRDPIFGVMVACGAGGTATEAIDDVAIERAPVDAATARAMLLQLRLMQKRLRAEPDLDRLAAFVSRFSRLAASAPWPRFAFEVNPVKCRPDRAVAVDGLLVIDAC